MIKVSVIIPSYNYGQFIGRAIRSALDQTYPKSDYEIIVVDDCSTDNSKDIISAFGKKIKTIFLPKNVGLPAVRNIGIFNARGDYVTFLDADDCLNKNFIQSAMLYYEFMPQLQLVAHDVTIIADNDEHLDKVMWDEYNIVGGAIYKLETMYYCGLFDETKGEDEDFDFLERYTRETNGYIKFTDLPLYRYRWHENNKSKGREIWQRVNIQNLPKNCTQSLN
mgnify:CR=1 FL=1